MIILNLPWPNSANTHWRHARGRTYVSPKGVAFREAVKVSASIYNERAPDGRLMVGVELYPPNKRIIDIDNRIKPLLDALTHAGIIIDDSLIDKIIVERKSIIKDGKCRVFISNYIPDYVRGE